MIPLTAGELLALYAILTTSRAPGAPRLAARVLDVYNAMPRDEEASDE